MINIDTVYQKVLALANKEQRGYITPQEFNLLVDKAQKDIINNYFHGVKTAYYKPKNQTEGFDETEMLNEKLHYLRWRETKIVSNTDGTAWVSLPSDLYKIATISWAATANTAITPNLPIEIVEVDNHVLIEMLQNPLTTPNYKRPVYVNAYQQVEDPPSETPMWINIYPTGAELDAGSELSGKFIQHGDDINIEYWRIPQKPEWGYVVVNGKALYNTNTSKNILLHPSEEEPIVTRILELAGIVIDKLQLTQAAAGDKMNTMQIQNS